MASSIAPISPLITARSLSVGWILVAGQAFRSFRWAPTAFLTSLLVLLVKVAQIPQMAQLCVHMHALPATRSLNGLPSKDLLVNPSVDLCAVPTTNFTSPTRVCPRTFAFKALVRPKSRIPSAPTLQSVALTILVSWRPDQPHYKSNVLQVPKVRLSR